MNYDKKIILTLACMCMMSYKKYYDIENSYYLRPYNINENFLYKCKEKPICYINNNDNTSLYICNFSKTLVIVFRGTSNDSYTNFKFLKVKLKLNGYDNKDLPFIHKGFSCKFLNVKNYLNLVIKNYIKNNYNKPITFCGHSLGGALATISCCYFANKYKNTKMNCITFGSPRVGCDKFVEIYNKSCHKSFRYVLCNDPIPHIPSTLRYGHVRGLQWLTYNKQYNDILPSILDYIKIYLSSYLSNGYNVFYNHKIQSYINHINMNI